MNKNLVASVLAMFSATTAFSQSATSDDGLYIKPTCSTPTIIRELLLEDEGESPTGTKATSPKYDLEIYADKKDGSWSLVGDDRKGKLCIVATGNRGYPDRLPERKWWPYFKQK